MSPFDDNWKIAAELRLRFGRLYTVHIVLKESAPSYAVRDINEYHGKAKRLNKNTYRVTTDRQPWEIWQSSLGDHIKSIRTVATGYKPGYKGE